VTRQHRTYAVILLGAILWCSAIVLAPLLGGSSGIGAGLYAFFEPICHQMDDRSFHLAGHPLGVCMRCSAIYFSFLAGVVLYPAVRRIGQPKIPGRTWLVLAAAPMLLDVVADVVGMHTSTPVTRLVSGSMFGFLIAFTILPAALEAATYGPRHFLFFPSARKES